MKKLDEKWNNIFFGWAVLFFCPVLGRINIKKYIYKKCFRALAVILVLGFCGVKGSDIANFFFSQGFWSAYKTKTKTVYKACAPRCNYVYWRSAGWILVRMRNTLHSKSTSTNVFWGNTLHSKSTSTNVFWRCFHQDSNILLIAGYTGFANVQH